MRQLSVCISILLSLITCQFATSSAIVHMTQNTLNGAKFYELRRSPQKLRDSFAIKSSTNTTPTVICTSDHIGLKLNEYFPDIRIFPSETSEKPECTSHFTLEMDAEYIARINGPCGVKRVYKGVPANTVDYSVRLIVSHDPKQVTEWDRIYDVTCSLHLKTLEVVAEYDVVTVEATTVASKIPKPGPKCKYSLHQKAIQGPKTAQAHVGEIIYHRWKCASPTKSDGLLPKLKYIFKVYACVVHDENNRYYTIIDENGCSLDEDIIPTPEYDVEHGLIYTPSKAFRFANSNHVHFKCMISVCSAADPECQSSVPPKCAKKQKKRELPVEMTIEQRLLRINELMKLKRSNGTVEVGGAYRRRPSQMVETESLSVFVNKDYDHQKYDHIIRTYQVWTWILCTINVFLVVLCVIITFRCLKNKYIMDIKDTKNTVFRRVPF